MGLIRPLSSLNWITLNSLSKTKFPFPSASLSNLIVSIIPFKSLHYDQLCLPANSFVVLLSLFKAFEVFPRLPRSSTTFFFFNSIRDAYTVFLSLKVALSRHSSSSLVLSSNWTLVCCLHVRTTLPSRGQSLTIRTRTSAIEKPMKGCALKNKLFKGIPVNHRLFSTPLF